MTSRLARFIMFSMWTGARQKNANDFGFGSIDQLMPEFITESDCEWRIRFGCGYREKAPGAFLVE